MTSDQINDVIETFLKTNKRLPKPKELVSLVDDEKFTTAKANGYLMRARKALVTLNVIDGKLYSDSGKVVWYRSTGGSMMPARFDKNESIGDNIYR